MDSMNHDYLKSCSDFEKIGLQGKFLVSQLAYPFTPARTHSISVLKFRVLKFIFLALKMMVKSSHEFILKFTKPLQRYLLTCQANSAFIGRFFFALASSNSVEAR